jgi:hypothetical protein
MPKVQSLQHSIGRQHANWANKTTTAAPEGIEKKHIEGQY